MIKILTLHAYKIKFQVDALKLFFFIFLYFSPAVLAIFKIEYKVTQFNISGWELTVEILIIINIIIRSQEKNSNQNWDSNLRPPDF